MQEPFLTDFKPSAVAATAGAIGEVIKDTIANIAKWQRLKSFGRFRITTINLTVK
jgi:hypothetical protein